MRIFVYFIFCSCFSVYCVFADAGSITYINRWPTTAPNVIAKAGDHVFYGDGEVIAVYDSTTNPVLTPVARVSIRLTEKDDLTGQQSSGTEGISGMFYANGFLYVACGNEGLQIYEIPTDLSAFNQEDHFKGSYVVAKGDARAVVRDVAVAGGYAYIGYYWLSSAGYDSGIQVVDVSDPNNPFRAGETELPATWAQLKRVQSITVAGGYAYVADMYNGLVVFDLSDPISPEIEAVCYMPSVQDVSISGNYAYLVCAGYGLQTVNIDPSNFSEENDILKLGAFCQYDGSTTKATSVETSGNFAYIGDVDLGLVIVDISSPDEIDDNSVIGQYPDAQGAYRLHLDSANQTVYIGDCRQGLQKITVSTPTSPALIATVTDTGTPADADTVLIDTDTSYVFTLDDDVTSGGIKEGVRIFFAIVSEDYVSFLLKGMFPTDGEASDIAFSGGYLYVADGSGGLKIIDPGLPAADAEGNRDTAGPVNPVLKGSCSLTGNANGVFVDENGYAYVAAGIGGLKVINVSDPALPILEGELAGADVSDARKVIVKADYAFIADGDNGLKIIDISNKSAPFLTGTYYIADSDDIDDIAGCAMDVSVVGTLAYVAAYNEGFHVFIVSDPYNPEYLADYSANPYRQIQGIYAARSDESESVDLIWVANGTEPDDNMGFFVKPSTVPPQRSAAYHTSGDVKDVFVVGDFVYLADSAGGFQTLTVYTGEDEDSDWDDDVVPVDTHRNKNNSCFVGASLSAFADDILRLISTKR